jgi:2-succinyl-5-enolpyruvyl-6-hydroxy-3-cyclohexene-1-carboxylate synthase
MTASDSHLLLRAFCDELARCGMEHACTSPGSRSAPIVLALVREPRIRCWSHIDERCAGFFALGAAKASGTPVALTCTSGTAAANFAPAVIEAWQARVPLIVLTADRPPELREVGAGQAIDQLKLYGDAVKWFFEVGVDTATVESVRWMRQLACRAYWTAQSGRPGPVHLNFPLREPLVPTGPLPPDPLPGRPGGRPWVTATTPSSAIPSPNSASPGTPSPATPAPRRELTPRGVVVAGRSERGAGLGIAVAQFAQRAGYPLLADPLSGARRGPVAIATYDLLLRDEDFGRRMRPELVIRVGDLPTSKPLRAWLASLADVEQVGLDAEAAWQDPAAVLSEVWTGDPAAALEAWHPRSAGPDASDPTPAQPGWLAGWREADAAASAVIDQQLGSALSEPLVARRLGDWLAPEATLFVASSMAIRDVELYFPAGEALPRVLSNRGANGIDGTVSSAFGAAATGAGPVVLLIGDVALAHDIGGLLAARRLNLDLTIVLLNNDGGGIFHFLPVATQADGFEEHVATPHGLDFAHAAALYGCAYQPAETVDQLEAAIKGSLAETETTTLIEVRTNRAENLVLHRRIAQAALGAR